MIAAGTTAFMANYFSFTQEVTARHTGLVVGYLGALGNLAAAGFQPFAGAVKDLTGSYALVFAIIGLAPLHRAGGAVLGLGRGPSPGRRGGMSAMRARLALAIGLDAPRRFWQDPAPHLLSPSLSTSAARTASRSVRLSIGRTWTRTVSSGKVGGR